MTHAAVSPRLLTTLLMLGLLGWGIVHAVGAFRFNHDLRRGLVVLGCMAAFLGFWLWMLRQRSRRLARLRAPATTALTTQWLREGSLDTIPQGPPSKDDR